MSSSNGNGYHAGIADVTERLLPPQNLEAEEAILGSILLDNACLAGVRDVLAAEDFFRDNHQIIYRAICDMDDAGSPVDCVLLAEELTRREQFKTIGGDEELARILAATPHATNVRYYADIVRQKAMMRAAIQFAEETIRSGYSQTQTAADLVSRAGDRFASLTAIQAEQEEVFSLRPWPDPPGPAVYQGLAGEILRLIGPHTESDPMALLVQFLVAYGNVIGRRAHWRVEQTRHYCNLFLCIVGNSSKARKGTSWDYIEWLFRRCDERWTNDRVLSGLSSGEGLIWSVRDAILRREKVGGIKALGGGGYQEVEVDPGVADKRALFQEPEFGSILGVMGRDGNTLSGVIRQAWDKDRLHSSTKNNPAHASGAHVSIIAHVTSEDLHRRLTQTDAANGFANRFLWICARRSRYLPHGGRIHTVNFADVVAQLKEAIDFARDDFADDGAPMVRDSSANELWEEVYPALSEAKAGLLGAVTSRAEAQAMRIAAIYALLDRSKWIRRHHLEAGLAVWRYAEQSAAYIFGDQLADPDGEKVAAALRKAFPAGLSSQQIRRQVFHGHRSGAELNRIMGTLTRAGLAEMEVDSSTRKPTTRWRSVQVQPQS